MKKGIRLKIAASTISVLLLGSLYYVVKDQKQITLANKLLKELKNRFNPSQLGLLHEKAFDVSYLNRVLNAVSGQVVVLKKSRAIQLANQLHSAWKPWYVGGDQEAVLFGVFRLLEDKVQVSQIAKAYDSQYGINLIDKLIERLDSQEISTVLRIVRTLPDYRVI